MMRNSLIAFFLLTCTSGILLAQAPCGLDRMTQSWVDEQPERIREIQAYDAQLPELAAATANQRAAFIIPVAVHVIHKGEPVGSGTHVSDARINSQLEILNEDFQRLNDDANQTPASFQGVAVDAGIMFCLAVEDPQGNPTTGITKHVYQAIPNEDFIENTIKPNTTWDADRYLNIWVVDIPDPSFLGYSYLPTSTMVGSVRDGLVVDYLRFGAISNSNRGRTATHEIGHYLGLRHTWGNNDTSGNPIGCTSDDGVADTPNCDGPYFNCPFSGSSCGSDDMYMNYMDYTDDDCMNLFTQGQASVMHSILNGIRSQLVSGNLTDCTPECKNLANTTVVHGFEANQSNNEWIIVNQNNDERTWVVVNETSNDWGPNQGNGMAVYFWNNDGVTSADDYLFTPCLSFKKDHEYRLQFSYACAEDASSLYPEKFQVGFSGLQSSSDFEVPDEDWIFDPVDNAYPDYMDAEFTFMADNDESLSIGFHIYSEADQYALQIDDIRIEDMGLVPTEDPEDETELVLRPNPTHAELTVNRPYAMNDNSDLVMYAVNGQRIRAWKPAMEMTEVQLDLSELPAGIYLLKWTDDTHQWTGRIVKIQEP